MKHHSHALGLLLVISLLSGASCRGDKNRQGKDEAATERIRKPLPEIAIDAVPAPSRASVVFRKSMSLGDVCREIYGDPNAFRVLLVYNDLSEERIPADFELKTPSIARMFGNAGADPRYQPAFNALGKVWSDYHSLLPVYLEQRSAQQPNGSGSIVLRAETKAGLEQLADLVEGCCSLLENVREPHQAPRLAIGQLRQAATQLRELSTGAVDGYGYDVDLVHQRLGRGLANALIWVKAGHR